MPPTVFFFVGFNFIVLTTNLLVADYAVAVGNFMLATVAALVVGKAVISANAMPFLRLFDRAPLIQPILFKTAIYWIATLIARLAERLVHFSVIERNRPSDFAAYLISDFSWQRFTESAVARRFTNQRDTIAVPTICPVAASPMAVPMLYVR